MKSKPTVLLVEKIHPTYMAKLEKHARVVRPLGHEESTLASVAAGEHIDAIVIRTSGCVSRKVIEASPTLKIIARHGIGVDHIDIPAATEHGVWVVNTPGASRVAASEHTWAMILALAKKTTWADRAVRSGNFIFRNHNKAMQLEGKTLGVIGLGRIGGTVGEIAVRAFGMKLLYTDIVKYPAKEKRLNARKVPLKTLLSKSDIVTIHTPLDHSTRGLIGAGELSCMQPHSFLVNCARGAIVDAAAVAQALTSDKLGGAAFDVFEPEVPGKDHALIECDRVVLSPHFAAQTLEANLGYAGVVDDVLRVLTGKRPQWPLNDIK